MEYKQQIAQLRQICAEQAGLQLDDIVVVIKPYVAGQYYEDDEPDTRSAVEVLFYYRWNMQKEIKRIVYDVPDNF